MASSHGFVGARLWQTEAGCECLCHTRDPFLASLPKEALEALARTYDELIAKHIPNVAQDGPQNQANSNLAIEAEVVRSEAKETESRA